MSKGSTPRPKNKKKFDKEWERIFKNNKQSKSNWSYDANGAPINDVKS
tara:strand:+ start:721 stop:864 length:144 start_codon:yes stop_codon:yes gene_type:complete